MSVIAHCRWRDVVRTMTDATAEMMRTAMSAPTRAREKVRSVDQGSGTGSPIGTLPG
jgi:hypothetical protein